MNKSTLYIDRAKSCLKYERENIRIEVEGKLQQRVPLTIIDNIIIYGNAEIHSSVIHHCAENDIGIVFCKANSEELQMLLPKNHNDASIKLQQYAHYNDDEYRLQIARKIIKHKVDQQVKLLKHHSGNPKAIHDINQLISQIETVGSVNELMGYEGIIAKIYFQEFTRFFDLQWKFHGRNKFPALDPVNVVLSYFYIVLNKQCSIVAHARGLDPRVGFLHEIRFGRDSLACDLVEVLRVTVDELVMGLFKNDYFVMDDFEVANGRCLLTKSGRIKIFSQVSGLKQTAKSLIRDSLYSFGIL